MFILFCCVSSSLFCLYIAVPIPSFCGFGHGASLHLHTEMFLYLFHYFLIYIVYMCVDIVRKKRIGKCI